MNETPKTYAKREVAQFGKRKIEVTRLVTPTPKPAIEQRRG
jgi:hypothetical protein